jgi:hypothetical protein
MSYGEGCHNGTRDVPSAFELHRAENAERARVRTSKWAHCLIATNFRRGWTRRSPTTMCWWEVQSSSGSHDEGVQHFGLGNGMRQTARHNSDFSLDLF